jgi:hypothetical protein
MIISVAANLKEIEEKGRDFAWWKPQRCLRCRESGLWGHGFVAGFFDGFAAALLLRRYRCPLCKCVIKLRPMGYFDRFQASIEAIRFHVTTRLKRGKWERGFSGSRGRHWLRALKRQTMSHLGMAWMGRLAEAFDRLLGMGVAAASRAV